MTENLKDLTESHEEIRKRGFLVAVISLSLVLIDQIVKIYIKTHFYLGEDVPITSWWQLKFIENNGMAFGMELSSKYILTFGRIGAVVAMIWFVCHILKDKSLHTGFFVAMALVIAGAAGNIFDCVFYGVIFNNPFPPEVARIFPPDGGYAPLFQGKVVDMLYFPLFSFEWPECIPLVGGQNFEFFQYIFNIADASICVGVALIIFFYSKDASQAFSYIGESFHKKHDNSQK